MTKRQSDADRDIRYSGFIISTVGIFFRNSPLSPRLNRMKIEKRSSNYENVENYEVAGCAIDIVGCGNHCIRGATEGRANATAKR